MSDVERQSVSVIEVVAFCLRHRRRLVRWPFLAGLAVVAIGLTARRTYTAEAAFVPQSSTPLPAGVAGVAAQFGLNLPGSDLAESPQFYADLVEADNTAKWLVGQRYRWRDGAEPREGSLVDAFEARGADSGRRTEAAVELLKRKLSTKVNVKTSVITIAVKTNAAELSQAIAERAIDFVGDFNLKKRQSRAASERLFAESRLSERERMLRRAEDSLQTFLLHNREYRSSPNLIFQHDRLEREVATNQDVYSAMLQAVERARIEEVRNVPVVTVVVQPVAPSTPDSRRLLIKALLAAIAVFAVAAALSAFQDAARGGERAESTPEELERLTSGAFRDLRNPVRALFRRDELI